MRTREKATKKTNREMERGKENTNRRQTTRDTKKQTATNINEE